MMSAGALHALILSGLFAMTSYVALEQAKQRSEIVRLVTILEQTQSTRKTNAKRTDRYVQATD